MLIILVNAETSSTDTVTNTGSIRMVAHATSLPTLSLRFNHTQLTLVVSTGLITSMMEETMMLVMMMKTTFQVTLPSTSISSRQNFNRNQYSTTKITNAD